MGRYEIIEKGNRRWKITLTYVRNNFLGCDIVWREGEMTWSFLRFGLGLSSDFKTIILR